MEIPTLKDIGHLTKFNGSNFQRWKCGLRLLLEHHQLIDIIDGTETKPAEVRNDNNVVTNAAQIQRWKERDVAARNYLFATTDDDLRDTLCTATTAANMYERIRNQHARTAADNRLILLQQFTEYKFQQGHNVTSHVTALELLWSRLTEIGETILESQVIAKILSTLPPTYRHFYTTWNNSPETGRTVKLLLTKLQEEEAITQAFNRNNPPTEGAYFTPNHFQNPVQQNQHQPSQQSYSRPHPYLMSRGSHQAERGGYQGRGGYQTGRGGYPGVRGGYRGGFRGNFRGFRSGPHTQGELCSYCGLGPHKVTNCRNRIRDENESFQQQSNANVSHAEQTSENLEFGYTSQNVYDFETFGFVADSGASEHMTDKRSILINFTPIQAGTHSVHGIGNTCLEAKGRGDIEVVNTTGTTLLIKDVLFVPGLGINLFSISATTSKGAEAICFKDMVNIYRDGQLEMTGQRASEKLYYLDIAVKVQESCLSATSRPLSITIWHQRLGHINNKTIMKMSKNNATNGLKIEESSNPSTLCHGCILGKMHRSSFPNEGTRKNCVGELIHSDVCGPMETMSPGKSRYYVLFKDDFSGWCEVQFMKNKSEVFHLFQNFVATFKTQYNYIVRTLRSDGGGGYIGREFEEWLKKNGIRHEKSAPYTPEQNGISERTNRTIMESARSMYLANNLPNELWAEAVAYATYIQNRVVSTKRKITPFEIIHGRKPDVHHIRIFGSTAFVHTPDALRRKLDPKATEGIFVGCCESTKAYRIWIPSKRRVEISRNVIVDEQNQSSAKTEKLPTTTPFDLFFHQESTEDPKTDDQMTSVGTPTEVQQEQNESPDARSEDTTMEIQHIEEDAVNNPIAETEDTNNSEELASPEENTDQPTAETVTTRRKSSRTPIFNEKFLEWKRSLSKNKENKSTSFGMEVISTILTEKPEPRTYKEAMESEDAEKWKTAIEEEYKSLMSNYTWVLVTRPNGRNIVGSKWVFKVKPGYTGVAERHKARLVAKGFTQHYGTDYNETFSPVLKYNSLRTILAITAQHNLNISLLDVKTAFLNGDLNEEVFMEQPEGFVERGKENQVCLLKKSLYGLKQAPRMWNVKFNQFLIKFGLTRSELDSCVYFSRNGADLLIIAIFVDDGLARSD